nr:lipase family protein [Microbacterium endophyticum]
MLQAAPARVIVLVGIGVALLGGLVVFKPLASLVLLGIYVSLSAIASGLIELVSRHPGGRWWRRVLATAWITGGILILVWLGRSIELLPVALAVLLVIAGLASVGDALSPRALSARVLALVWGTAQILFGVLSLSWPDVTLLAVAVLFGVRTIIFGIELIITGVRGLIEKRRRSREADAAPPVRSSRVKIWVALGRYGLAMLLVVTMVTGWQLNDWLADGAPVVDSFYDPPSDVPEGHGRLIREGDYAGRAPSSGEVRRILYTTEDEAGDAAIASAMVIQPTELSPGPHKVVIWNHGTTGIAQGCAPSLSDGTATKWAIPALEEMLARGWIVVAPDYSGQGAEGHFPYLIGVGEARSALDAVLAAGELSDLTLSPTTISAGHSQGGHAALWTSQIVEEYTPGLDIVGTAAFAPAADPLDLAERLTSDDAGALLTIMMSWVLVPYAETYPDIELSRYVATGARSIIREMSQRCLSEPGLMVSALTALGLSEDSPVRTRDLTVGAFGRRLAENVPTGPWGSPMFFAWGAEDDVIPPEAQRTFTENLCEEGELVRTREVSDRGHQDILQPGSDALQPFLRWADAAMTSTPEQIEQSTPYSLVGCQP